MTGHKRSQFLAGVCTAVLNKHDGRIESKLMPVITTEKQEQRPQSIGALDLDIGVRRDGNSER